MEIYTVEFCNKMPTIASKMAIGGVLSQVVDGTERPIAYFSKNLNKPENQYCVTRRELLAVVKGTEHFHTYLYGNLFLVRTDHASLQWLLSFKNPEGQMARWLQKLQQYNFDVEHRAGKHHGNAAPCPGDHVTKTDAAIVRRGR